MFFFPLPAEYMLRGNLIFIVGVEEFAQSTWYLTYQGTCLGSDISHLSYVPPLDIESQPRGDCDSFSAPHRQT